MIPTIFFGFSACFGNDLDKELNKFYQVNNLVINNKTVDDYTFVRRIYLDLAGRIPTTEEIKSFISSKQPNKKNSIIEKIMYSEDYVNNFYNFYADLLRIRPERLGDGIQMKSYPYMEYVRDFIRSDKPYDKFVEEMLTAKGKITENPATSYFIRDEGMSFDNLAITGQIFIGKSLACAQCHDDPFQDYSQKQFYELAAFMTNNNRENRKDYRDILKRVDEDIKKITGKDRIDNNVRQLMGSNLFNISDDDNKRVIFPPDYKYDNAKPGEVAVPATFDNKFKEIKTDKRKTFANWLIHHDDFSHTIANRIWMDIVGYNLCYPEMISNFTLDNLKNKEILQFLGKYLVQNNYSIKSLVRLIVSSDFYSRPAYIGSDADCKNQAIMVKRLNAHKLWDSILTLILEDPNYSRISFNKYSELFKIDWNNVSGESLLKQVEDIRLYEKSLNENFLKAGNIELARSCFLLNKNNGFIGSFLKEFGASERILIDTQDNGGSITQLLTLMNSSLINVVSSEKSQIMQSFKREHSNKDVIFVSIMGRPIGIFERDIISKTSPEDLVWILMNTKEFLFRK